MGESYICGYCNVAFDSVEQRTACEMKCAELARKKREEEEKRRTEEEKSVRYSAVVESLNQTIALYEKYVKDYGEIFLETDCRSLPFSLIFNLISKF